MARSDARTDRVATPSSGWPHVLVEAEDVRRIVATLDPGQPLVRAVRIGGPDPLVPFGTEEIGVHPGSARREGVEELRRPGIVRGGVTAELVERHRRDHDGGVALRE